MHELNKMNLKPGLGASYAIQPQNGVGLFYSSQTHKGLWPPKTS